MTSLTVQILLCLAAWAVVLIRLLFMRWENIRRDHYIALKVWLMMFFFAIGVTCLMDFALIIDIYTANNFSRLLAYCSFPIAINFGLTAAFNAVGKPQHQQFIGWSWFLLAVTMIIQGIIYTFFLSGLPEFSYYQIPHSLPEALFVLIEHSFETIQGLLISKMFLDYLPLETSIVMSARLKVILFGNFAIGVYWLLMITVALGYFYPFLSSPMLHGLAAILAAFAISLQIIVFLPNKIYARFVILWRKLDHWRAFQDLQYLVLRMTELFPLVGLPPSQPGFWQFLRNPESHLYRTMIIILDGRTMLTDFLLEVGQASSEPEEWEIEEGDNLVREVQEVGRALQTVNPPDDFFETVAAYRRVSKILLAGQSHALKQAHE